MRFAASILVLLAAVAAVPAPLRGADDSDEATIGSIMLRWAKAQGWNDSFATPWSYEARGRTLEGEPAVASEFHRVVTGRGQVREEVTFASDGGAALVLAFDGRFGWRSHSLWGLGPLSRDEIIQFLAGAEICPTPRNAWYLPKRTLLSPEDVDGIPCLVVGMSTREGPQERWYFSRNDGLLLRIVRPVDWSHTVMERDFSSFRRVGRFTVPFHVHFSMGKWSKDVTYASIEFDPSVDDTLFVPTMEQMAEIEASSAVLARQAAVSGASAQSNGIHTRVVRSTNDSTISGIHSQTTLWIKAPNRVRSETIAPGVGRTVQVYDGHDGWMESDTEGFHVLKAKEVSNLFAQVNLTFVTSLAPQCPLRRNLGERTVAGRKANVLALAGPSGPIGTLYFDKESGRLVRILTPRVAGAPGAVIDLSDFRPVGKTEIPFVTTVSRSTGQEITRVLSVQDNVPVPDGLFDRPPPGR